MKCPKCKNKMKPTTMEDDGDVGYAFECTDCSFIKYSEITEYIGYIWNSEEDRRKGLEEFEM